MRIIKSWEIVEMAIKARTKGNDRPSVDSGASVLSGWNGVLEERSSSCCSSSGDDAISWECGAGT